MQFIRHAVDLLLLTVRVTVLTLARHVRDSRVILRARHAPSIILFSIEKSRIILGLKSQRCRTTRTEMNKPVRTLASQEVFAVGRTTVQRYDRD